ncbi:MAG: sugar ABC transporter permease [Armatimonadetes bacterium]|nr:sugar ABC transporter permease [Armatimonadota bacterium]
MRRAERTRFIITFLSPALLLYTVFVIYPLGQSLYISLFNWRGVSKRRSFIWLENFQKVLHDEVFWKSLKNNLWILLIGGFLVMAIGLALAQSLQRRTRGGNFVQNIMLFPQIMSLVVVAVVWQFVLNPSIGLVNSGLALLGLKNLQHAWLGEVTTALPSVIGVYIWCGVGFFALLFSAGLQNIDKELKEASQLDGASGSQQFTRITWPLLWPIRKVATIYTVINGIQVFALVYLMTRGGPDHGTDTLLSYLYFHGFENYQFGYATAIAVLTFLLTTFVSLSILLIYRKSPMESAR